MRGREIALAAGLVIVALLVIGLWSGGMMGYGRGGPYGGRMGPGMMGGFGFGWGIVALLFWALVIGGVVFLIVRLLDQNPSPAGPHARERQQSDSALDILRERYARGEITKEEFDQMRRDLQ